MAGYGAPVEIYTVPASVATAPGTIAGTVLHGLAESLARPRRCRSSASVPSPCVGETVSEVFWREFLRSIVARGLSGVLLGVTAIHESLTRAIVQVVGCPWQRCPVHVLRDVQGLVHRSQRRMVAAVIRQVFAAAEPGKLRSRLADVVATLEAAAPKVALLLEAAEEELLAFMRFPRQQ